MNDRFERIKERVNHTASIVRAARQGGAHLQSSEDAEWLIAEVERLRENNDDLAQAASSAADDFLLSRSEIDRLNQINAEQAEEIETKGQKGSPKKKGS